MFGLAAQGLRNARVSRQSRERFSWSPQKPTERQRIFLDCAHKEALYGGAAGGAKSSALLIAALEYVDVPNYSALLLRRTFADLNKPNALMDRLRSWLTGTAARWIDRDKCWVFPSGAKISFGYCDTENDKYTYQGAEYQFVGFDELTQFSESQYLYLFSRLRRLEGSDIPIRMRAATNPGGVGSAWVKERFIPENFTPAMADEPRVFEVEGDSDDDGLPTVRAFIPARVDDNPHLDRAEYRKSLQELDVVTREQLLKGDWSIVERGNIYPMWDERDHVIAWSEFERVFGERRIPKHWLLGVGHDFGFTEGHPYAVSFVAQSAENSKLPGRMFLYRELVGYEASAREVGQRIVDAMAPDRERERVRHWLMSHEKASERAEYQRIHRLPFRSWKPDANGGIAQVRDYLEIQQRGKPNPFRPERDGQPTLYFVVDDAELVNPKTERGLSRHRAEIAVYRYATLRSGEEATRVAPHPLFNDAMDALRGLASQQFAPMKPMTAEERAFDALKQRKQLVTLDDLAEVDDLAASAKVFTYMQNLNDEMARQKKSEGGVVNPRLKHQVR